MIKSTANKTDFSDQALELLERFHAVGVKVQSTSFDVVMVIDRQDGEPVTVALVHARTTYGADATAEKWQRWAAECLAEHLDKAQRAARKGESLCAMQRNRAERAALGAGLGRMTDEQIKAWADTRKGWAVFFLTAWLEDGEIRSGAEPWAHITGAGLDGHIFVEVADVSRSIPLHMVINSAAELGAMSTPDSGGAARGAPAMCYAVFSPDTPDGAINDQLEKFEAELRAAIKTLIRQAVADDLAKVRNLAAAITPDVPAPSLIQSAGEHAKFPFGLEPQEVTNPASGSRPYLRHVYAVDLPGWQDPDLVRRQRDLLAFVVSELIACADPSRDFNELRRARDLLEQARKAGAPV